MNSSTPSYPGLLKSGEKSLKEIKRVLFVGSGKGGVGKSFVACGLSLRLASLGFRTGLFDMDLHGASVPIYLGLRPPIASSSKGLEPLCVGENLVVMSVSLLTGNYPVPVLGIDKQSVLGSLFAQTNWGEKKLDFLVVDLPPGTSDELLAAFVLFPRKSSILVVTTPSPGTLEIVSRLSQLADDEKIPKEGIVVNMAYSRNGRNLTYPFGKTNTKLIERQLGSKILTFIPLETKVGESPDLRQIMSKPGTLSTSFEDLARKIVDHKTNRKSR
jgi:ATP-binding protein involved in chromosome partitioning